MKNRTWHILKTYWKRPLILLLLIPLVTSFIALVLLGEGESRVQIAMRPHERGRVHHVFTELLPSEAEKNTSLETIPMLLKRMSAKQVQSLNMVCLHVGDPLPDLSVLPNLQYLRIHGFKFTQENIDHLCALPLLDALVIEQWELPPGALAQLGQKVSELEVLGLSLDKHQAELSHMTKVKLLAVNPLNASPDLIQHIAQLPNIETLTLVEPGPIVRSKNEHWQIIELSQKEINTLTAHPKLKEIYANWSERNPQYHLQLDALLPLRALPTSFSQNRLIAINLTVVASFVIFAIVALQLWAHLISPSAAVVPNYLQPHRNVGLGILIVGLLTYFLLLLRYGFALLPTLCIVLYFPSVCCLYSIALNSKNKVFATILIPLLFASFLLSAMFSSVLFELYASSCIWFFRNNLPVFTALVLLIEIVCIAGALNKLPLVTVLVNENSVFAPAYSFWDVERAQKRQMEQAVNSWLYRRMDAETKTLRYRGDSTLQMVSLWRSGNMFRARSLLGFIALMILFGLLIHLFRVWFLEEELFAQDLRWMNGLFSAPISIGIALPALIWWQRRNSMEAEFMRPVNRPNLIKQLHLALVIDHGIVLLGALAISGMLAYEGQRTLPELLCLMALDCVAGPLWMVGVNMSVFVCKESWKAVALMIGLYMFAFILVMLTAIADEELIESNLQSLIVLVVATVFAILAALGLNLMMHKAALRREWG